MPTPPSLRELQCAFAAAIVDGVAPALEPWIAARGIAPAARLRIYRNANFATHVDALAIAFPALHRLLGEDCFDGLATRHAAFRGSRSGNLQAYGADFADYLAAQPETAAWPWLGEVARLEWLRQEVALLGDAAPMTAAALVAAIGDARDDELRLRPLPHVRVLSSAVPVLDLWRYALQPDGAAPDPTAGPQSVLLWREGAQLAMRTLAPAQAAFVRALSADATLPQALNAARLADAETAPEFLLRPLLEHALIAATTSPTAEASPA